MICIFWVDHKVVWPKECILVLGNSPVDSSIYCTLEPHGEGLDVVLRISPVVDYDLPQLLGVSVYCLTGILWGAELLHSLLHHLKPLQDARQLKLCCVSDSFYPQVLEFIIFVCWASVGWPVIHKLPHMVVVVILEDPLIHFYTIKQRVDLRQCFHCTDLNVLAI